MKNKTLNYTIKTALIQEDQFFPKTATPVYLVIDWKNEAVKIEMVSKMQKLADVADYATSTYIPLVNGIDSMYLNDCVEKIMPEIKEIEKNSLLVYLNKEWHVVFSKAGEHKLTKLSTRIRVYPEDVFVMLEPPYGIQTAEQYFQEIIGYIAEFYMSERKIEKIADRLHTEALIENVVIAGGVSAIKTAIKNGVKAKC